MRRPMQSICDLLDLNALPVREDRHTRYPHKIHSYWWPPRIHGLDDVGALISLSPKPTVHLPTACGVWYIIMVIDHTADKTHTRLVDVACCFDARRQYVPSTILRFSLFCVKSVYLSPCATKEAQTPHTHKYDCDFVCVCVYVRRRLLFHIYILPTIRCFVWDACCASWLTRAHVVLFFLACLPFPIHSSTQTLGTICDARDEWRTSIGVDMWWRSRGCDACNGDALERAFRASSWGLVYRKRLFGGGQSVREKKQVHHARQSAASYIWWWYSNSAHMWRILHAYPSGAVRDAFRILVLGCWCKQRHHHIASAEVFTHTHKNTHWPPMKCICKPPLGAIWWRHARVFNGEKKSGQSYKCITKNKFKKSHRCCKHTHTQSVTTINMWIWDQLGEWFFIGVFVGLAQKAKKGTLRSAEAKWSEFYLSFVWKLFNLTYMIWLKCLY